LGTKQGPYVRVGKRQNQMESGRNGVEDKKIKCHDTCVQTPTFELRLVAYRPEASILRLSPTGYPNLKWVFNRIPIASNRVSI
jgi:hypothetical protein